jgi:hypothetical protein
LSNPKNNDVVNWILTTKKASNIIKAKVFLPGKITVAGSEP